MCVVCIGVAVPWLLQLQLLSASSVGQTAPREPTDSQHRRRRLRCTPYWYSNCGALSSLPASASTPAPSEQYG